jgi:hypothetical protein
MPWRKTTVSVSAAAFEAAARRRAAARSFRI